ncbi:tyrosine-type recombinase/integrase [Saccharopolyspora shandongensis]|uniref:tyrosine-type recombinase/integrase n=1 Tax=Saccharopolyspora shandongensis TaxID=418495 RepID=UPI0033C12AAA
MESPLLALRDSWRIAMRAERKSAKTIYSYCLSVELYDRWCGDHGHPARVDRDGYRGYSAWLVDNGASANTLRTRQNALRRFAAWLYEEGEADENTLTGTKLAQDDAPAVEPYSPAELEAIVSACKPPKGATTATKNGRDALLVARRDEAVIRMLTESMVRADELGSMTISGTDVARGVALIVRGKGGKGRLVPFGPNAARALDRYLRVRRLHANAESDALWLGRAGYGFGYQALWAMVKRRARMAGVANVHPHRFRNTGATRWLDAGGSEGGLMAVAGWKRRDMIDRYVRATASERAITESRGLDLGDW